jgi:signal transduction histidine kinase
MRHKTTKQKNGSSELEQLGRLTGTLAHEIKNPLSTIQINLKLAIEELRSAREELRQSDGAALDRALRKIEIIQKEADRLEHILGTFLRYIDKTQLQLESVDINSVVGDMVDFYSPQARSHSITIRTGQYNGALVCRVDVRMLKQVILNLFINAQYAMEKGGELLIRTGIEKDFAQIIISDTGCGIEPGRLEKIFDAYYSSRPDGSGLGLATAKKIIEAHKGRISVNSKPGTGTSFTIELPVEKVSGRS